LADGRIFIGGGNGRDFDYEILSHPYMTMPRPTNLQWQDPMPAYDVAMDAHILNYGSEYEIRCDALPLGVAVDRVVLTAPCSVTHHSDMHQRYVELKTDVNNGNEVRLTMVDVESIAPRGLYMMWLLTTSGAPSEAMWVVVR
jgi:hypothetical protein